MFSSRTSLVVDVPKFRFNVSLIGWLLVTTSINLLLSLYLLPDTLTVPRLYKILSTILSQTLIWLLLRITARAVMK